jgi:histidyl-tRNA synthetase
VLDCKKPQCQPIADNAPHIVDYLGPECRTHWDAFLHLMAVQEIPYTINHRLVRGLDYYTKTTFEFWPPREGAQSTLGGGGRYDGLAELLGGQPTPGIGFGSGVERIILNLRDQGIEPPPEQGPLAYVAYLGDEVRDDAFRLLSRVRAAGLGASISPTARKLGDQLRRAEGLGARYAVIVGPDEIAAGQAGVRDLATRSQEAVPLDEVVSWLRDHA